MIWITQGRANYPRVNFRYVVVPSSQLDNSWVPIDFSAEHIEKLINIGLDDANKAIDEGEGKMFEHIQNYSKKSITNPTETETLRQFIQNKSK